MYTYMYTYMYCLHRYSFLVVHQLSFWCTAISGRIIIRNWSLKLKVIQLTQPFTCCIQKFQHKKINACDYAWALPKLHVHSTLLIACVQPVWKLETINIPISEWEIETVTYHSLQNIHQTPERLVLTLKHNHQRREKLIHTLNITYKECTCTGITLSLLCTCIYMFPWWLFG